MEKEEIQFMELMIHLPYHVNLSSVQIENNYGPSKQMGLLNEW